MDHRDNYSTRQRRLGFEDFDEPYPYGAVRGLVVAALASGIGAVIAYAFFVAAAAVGPNCPDKDPSWEGWCSEAPDKT